MGYQKGHAKMGGIQKGGKQKRTQFREAFESLLGKTIPERLHEIINMGGMDPLQEADLIVKLLPYCYTKLNAVDITADIQVTHEERVKEIEAKAERFAQLLVLK